MKCIDKKYIFFTFASHLPIFHPQLSCNCLLSMHIFPRFAFLYLYLPYVCLHFSSISLHLLIFHRHEQYIPYISFTFTLHFPIFLLPLPYVCVYFSYTCLHFIYICFMFASISLTCSFLDIFCIPHTFIVYAGGLLGVATFPQPILFS